MTVDEEIWDSIKDQINDGDVNPTICMLVDCIDEKKQKSNEILVVTESFVSLFEQSSQKRKCLFNFFQLKKLSFLNNQLSFESDSSKFSIIHSDIEDITNAILKNLFSIMNQDELPAIDCPGFNLSFGHDAASRLAAKLSFKGNIVSTSDIDAARSEFDDNSNELTLSQFSSFIDNLPLLLDCAGFRTGYKRINIDVELSSDILNALLSYLPNNKSFTEISFSAKITADFESFANSNNLNQIRQLIFQDFKFESLLIEPISKIINNSSLKLLQFSSCLDKNTLELLLSKFSSLDKFKEIPIIDFSQNDASILSNHLSLFSNTKKLVLQNCGMEILPVLQSLFALDGIKIESIDLSGNQCTESNSKPLNFPLSLNEIILDEVQFEYDTFDSLFTSLMNHSPQEDKVYHVSLVSISLKESEWRLFLSTIDEKSAPKLAKLNWSNNTVNKPFIRFINSTKSLLSLNISGCIDNTPETTCLIPTLLRQNYTIRELTLDTYDLNELEEEAIKSIIDNLENNHSLISLSLNDQPISDDNVIELANALMANRRIKKLCFNFTGIEDKETILSFFEKLADRGRPLHIKYPLEALENLRDSIDDYEDAEKTRDIENYKEGFIGKVNELYHKVINGNKQIKVPDESITFADQNGRVVIGGDNDDNDDEFNGINYDPIRKQDWTNNVASKIGASPEQMRQASAANGETGVQYQYTNLSDLPSQPSQVQPNYKEQITNQEPENLFDLSEDEIREIINNHRKDPSKVAPNRLPISPEEYRLYRKNYNSASLNEVPLGALPDLPPLGDVNGLPPVGNAGMPPPPNGMDLPPLGNVNMFNGSNLPPPPPNTGLPPPPTGMSLPPPPTGMTLPPPPKKMI